MLAFAGILFPGLHKFYLGQIRWGVCYLSLAWLTPISISKIASIAEGFWYLFQDREDFDRRFNAAHARYDYDAVTDSTSSTVSSTSVGLFADAIRQLEQLRQDGLISEYEFEQKRRQFLDRIG